MIENMKLKTIEAVRERERERESNSLVKIGFINCAKKLVKNILEINRIDFLRVKKRIELFYS